MEPARIVSTGQPASAHGDALGERHRLDDPAGGPGIDAFVLRSSLATVPSFEFALRERASRLASFRHTAYVRVRSVERGSGPEPSLRIVSDAAPGVRLSDLLAGAEARRLPIDINAALCLVRQLVPAVAMLHESARDVAHGAIGPDRLVVTPSARLLITEYVLGAALEQLRYARLQYWKDLRIPVPPSAGAARFDHRADVTQIGMVALALILGRPIRDDEFPGRIGDVVASTWAVSPRGGFEPLPPGLRRWLGRTLQIDPASSFRSAVDARAELDKVLNDSDYAASPANVEAFLTRFDETPVVVVATPPGPAAAPSAEPSAAPSLRLAATVPPRPTPPPPVAFDSPPAPVPPAQTLRLPALHPLEPLADEGGADDASDADGQPDDRPAAAWRVASPAAEAVSEDTGIATVATPLWRNWRVMGGAAAAILVLVAGAAFVTRKAPEPRAAAAAPAASGTLEVATNPAGIEAIVDGVSRGSTPLTLALDPGAHTLVLQRDGDTRTIPLTIAAGAVVAHHVDMPSVPAGRSAAVSPAAAVPAPAVPASVVPAPIVPAPTVAASAPPVVASLGGPVAAPPRPAAPASGWLTVTTSLDVDVLLGGARIGGSRERIAVPPGTHEITLVNERLGVQMTRTVQVATGASASVDVAVPNGTLSVNAVPWADVWIDGEKVGETPIGNLSLPVGTHDVLFRHPDLGERHHSAVVTLTQPTRLSVDLRTQ